MLIKASKLFRLKGQLHVMIYEVNPWSGERKLKEIETHRNTVFSNMRTQIAKDYKEETHEAKPKVLAFSRSAVAASPQPSSLTNEFRVASNLYRSDNVLQLIGTMGTDEGNGSGNIRSVAIYYGSAATTTVGTGTLGTLINTLNIEKTSSLELAFQYEISFD